MLKLKICKNNSWEKNNGKSRELPWRGWFLEIRTHPDRGVGLRIRDFDGRHLKTAPYINNCIWRSRESDNIEINKTRRIFKR